MLRLASVALIGLVFSIGLATAGMSNPAKILNFFDPLGTWDPSLLLVMLSALGVTFLGYRIVLRRAGPLLDTRFHLPTKRDLDLPLVAGSALFGIGWGLAGLCPGGALSAVGTGHVVPLLFVAMMVIGMRAAAMLRARAARRVQVVVR